MPDIYMDVDAALSEVPVNKVPLIDDTDFKTIEAAVLYNAAGMALIWHFVTTAGVMTETAVTPTTAGVHDWTDQGTSGLYALEIPASAGTINNDTEGFGWFTGVATGVLPWTGPIIGFRAAALNNALIDGGDVLDVNLTEMVGVSQSATDLKDFADAGYDPATNKVQGVVLVDTSTAVTNQVTADMTAISGDSGAADTLESQYDGTGLTGDTYPATQAQVSSIVSTGAAINVLPIAAPNGFTLTTGSEVGDEDRTHALDGVRHELSDTAGTLDAVYKFDIGGDAAPVGITFTGLFNSANDSWDISANIGTDSTPVWQQLGTLSGSGGAGNTVHPFDMFANQIVTDLAGIVHIRVNGIGLTTSSFDSDQVFVSKSDTSRSVGYDGGQVWINTVGGTAGTEPYVNGTADKAVLTLADAITIASNVGLNRFDVSNESTITFTESHANEVWSGEGWTLALGGQNISQTHIYHCNDISGIGTTATGECHILHSHVGAITLGKSHITDCSFHSTFNAGAAGNYDVENCRSGVAGASNPTMTYTGLGSASTVNVRGWQGGAEWVFDSNITATVEVLLGGTHTITTGGGDIEFRGSPKALTVTTSGAGTTNIVIGNGAPIVVNGAAGTVNVYGLHGGITGTYSGSVTDNGVDVTDIPEILADTNELQTDDVPGLIAALNNLSAAQVNTECDTALTDYDGPTNAEMEARTPTAAQLAYIVANAATGVPVTFTTAGGSTTAAVLNLVDGSTASATDDQYNGRLLVFTNGTLDMVVTDITDYVGSTTTATITAIPFAPTSSHAARLI